ncbi:putative hydrolase of HD superfamily [Hydrogenivirga caldilitoris]|uniref:Putative hydrolase of HD superfamily n=2 Tax=Hydrogenivirga caldilitoris TaxID=246264 RepID=A0A497XRE4_9AQUI|nr:putative hydrolase of HD superfamily [Hydrogenivirga caldilitoris]
MYSGLSGIILKLYDLAYIERWNDHPKPFNITELDKQAHKAAIAYVIGRFEEGLRDKELNWSYLIEGLIFEAIQRAILTDIKPQVFHRLLKERSKEINEFVADKVGNHIKNFDQELHSRFLSYFQDFNGLEKRIIKASHFLATYWEFQMIYSVGIRFYGIERVKEEIEDTIEDFFDLVAVERIYLHKKTYNFIDLVGQLRFQKRWILSPRIPLTTVLGHMFIVAALSYLLSLKLGACQRRRFLNFFTGLFHDLPEVTTRDVIAPVKREAGISDILKDYEREQVERVILPLLPEFLREEFSYILGFLDKGDEFSNRIIDKGVVREVSSITESMNRDELYPIDGKLIKGCDNLGAYIEAALSLYHGVRSRHLKSAVESIGSRLKKESYEGIDFGNLVIQIDKELGEI